MADQTIFNRIEKKYLISSGQKESLLATVLPKLKKDIYYQSEVFNIYFDTKNYDLIIQSIDHPIFKEKLRARSYAGYDKVFIELKTKLRDEENIGFKRRLLISVRDYHEYARGGKNLIDIIDSRSAGGNERQIAKELDYATTHFALSPQILVYYKRESYRAELGTTATPHTSRIAPPEPYLGQYADLRITFDTELRYRTNHLNFYARPNDKKYFNNHQKNIIMEIKTAGALPFWLAGALSAHKIYPERFSKIGKIYQQLLRNNQV